MIVVAIVWLEGIAVIPTVFEAAGDSAAVTMTI